MATPVQLRVVEKLCASLYKDGISPSDVNSEIISVHYQVIASDMKNTHKNSTPSYVEPLGTAMYALYYEREQLKAATQKSLSIDDVKDIVNEVFKNNMSELQTYISNLFASSQAVKVVERVANIVPEPVVSMPETPQQRYKVLIYGLTNEEIQFVRAEVDDRIHIKFINGDNMNLLRKIGHFDLAVNTKFNGSQVSDILKKHSNEFMFLQNVSHVPKKLEEFLSRKK